MSQIQFALWDVGNVIVRATHKITEAILCELGVRPDKAALFFHNPAYGQFARGKITGEQFAQAVREVLEVPYLTDEQIRVAHDSHIYMVDWDVEKILWELKEKSVPLALVTTTNQWQTARERQFINLADRYGSVVRSHDIGMTKTDDGAWTVILKELGWQDKDPSTILFVDDAAANCATARRARLQVHQYDPTPMVGMAKLCTDLTRRGLLK
ncbi:hypothetical protein A3B21_04095 [Candidatus Uhrbacteria bacterium RIFCSPLOWO2_01_FULL_47_24]|uniref:HAD family hydrolase n=1 Tax=Candidatus Uhrbacteria bacterium RIFCSPLOWO2_01_FULL_47_24 TaxID=1802401 RepID=A0A1F7UTE2_9BACT|nr:MAG: hypothetical protein A2753_02690 [Candidatus Uhrbacteria bacterium RIFCSPHIGHO2_01_FULL_47_11]OGL68838.1 MAG: hypothetical protein A3D58_01300 [Candidatus Uhrbacteria bacterium RIFCSPHIGHO2_02_FULL_46_47]OGL76802.1 MAG: hypothetical protein A3F52_01915 [Candidatus Uhrbacteria bacterium RIFCSPHIGHO2_12_FULL_47_11]OGL81573.1 MAG: hypothetical protein A3B21_04095 [Candidatus Uhrbacteria bacterium RIFCSPLOWO2_01_FULL_47_24]OGL83955.1 MAG: hypothetical protein A3J03_00860 [Candidatus Uhrbact